MVMLRVSLIISTILVSAMSAAATVFVLAPNAENEPDVALVEPVAKPSSTVISTDSADPQASAPVTDVASLKQELDLLRQQLADAEAERSQLAETVVGLNRQVADLESSALNLASLASLQTADEQSLAGSSTNPDTGNRTGSRFPKPPPAKSRYDSLLTAGVDVTLADDITARRSRYQLDRLELNDLATREGWVDTDQYRERLDELAAERVDLREELGDETYDAYLFNVGRNNRVMIESIIPGSVAEAAGAQVGDLIMSYADTRIYRVADVQETTRGGSRGESVEMTLEREGQSVTLSVPRGPLGVSLDGLRISP